VHTHTDAPARRARPGGPSARFRRDPRLVPRDGSADDARLVAVAQTGDADALRELYLRFKDNVYGYVCSIVRDEHEAEDEVPFSGWLLRIARNMAIDHLRQRRPVPEEDLPDAGTLPIDRMLATFTLRSALEGLPEDQRRVVVLRHVVGLSPPEIAVRLGRTESSVHALHHRGRQRLRDELRREGAMPASRRVAAAH
jgi:RNA polymerase sigma-70 factor (ECF subfamily)